MRKRTRYLLLLVGFIVFLILAPAIVLYVRGVSYDFKTKTFVTTGILAVSTNPSDTKVLLNGVVKRQGSGDVKFLLPGEYQVTLHKDDYLDWNKRLTINPGQVTWTSPAFNNIYLFYSSPLAKNIATNVKDFYTNGDYLAYLNNYNFIVSSVDHPENTQAFVLPKPVDSILAHDDSNKNFILSQSNNTTTPEILAFNQSTGKFTDLSSLFNVMPQIQFVNGQLYALANNILYKINITAQTKTPLFAGVKTFYIQNNTLYFVKEMPDATQSLLVSQSPFSDTQTLLNNLPNFTQEQLVVTFEKQVLLMADNKLYLVNSSLESLADNVSQWNFDSQNSTVAVLHSGQLDYFNAFGNNLNFVTRSSEPLTNLTIKNNIDYAFFAKNNQLTAIELDTRDNQNQYSLYQGTVLQKFTIDSAGKNVAVLDGDTLKILTVR